MSLPPLFDRLRLPVIGAPLFIVSNPDLVIAQCKAGIVGSFPALNARPQSMLDEWIHRIVEELAAWDRDHPETPAAPFAVNQIVHRSNDRLEADMATCAKWKVPIVITSLAANAQPEYKQGIVEGRASDIVYSSYFTGVHGNYLKQSIVASGMDPANLPEGDLKTMNFAGGEGSKKAWRDIWGSGQGIGAIDKVQG